MGFWNIFANARKRRRHKREIKILNELSLSRQKEDKIKVNPPQQKRVDASEEYQRFLKDQETIRKNAIKNKLSK